MNRCSWVNEKNPNMIKYHDHEWCKPHYDDDYLFELLLLESFQAGLSWECIINKREAFRKALDHFNYKKISKYKEDKISELMQNPDIIRNRFKIKAMIQNAKIFQEIQKEFGSFSNYIWSFTNHKIIQRVGKKMIASNALSKKISKDLYKRGMRFVGEVIIYSYLQSIGMINDHEKTCDFIQ